MKISFTTVLLLAFFLSWQYADGEEYSIKGFLADGSIIDPGKILSESDSCTFTLIGVGQNIIEKTDGRWSLFLLDKDSTYFGYAFQNGNNRFSMKADTLFFPKFFVFNNLKAVYSEDSICAYTLAKVCYEASDAESGTLKAELLLRFNLLPEKPSFEYKIDPNNVSEDYGNLILNDIRSEKASEFNCIVKTHVGRRTYTNIYPIPLSQVFHTANLCRSRQRRASDCIQPSWIQC
jgi:hypothetical protein